MVTESLLQVLVHAGGQVGPMGSAAAPQAGVKLCTASALPSPARSAKLLVGASCQCPWHLPEPPLEKGDVIQAMDWGVLPSTQWAGTAAPSPAEAGRSLATDVMQAPQHTRSAAELLCWCWAVWHGSWPSLFMAHSAGSHRPAAPCAPLCPDFAHWRPLPGRCGSQAVNMHHSCELPLPMCCLAWAMYSAACTLHLPGGIWSQ